MNRHSSFILSKSSCSGDCSVIYHPVFIASLLFFPRPNNFDISLLSKIVSGTHTIYLENMNNFLSKHKKLTLILIFILRLFITLDSFVIRTYLLWKDKLNMSILIFIYETRSWIWSYLNCNVHSFHPFSSKRNYITPRGHNLFYSISLLSSLHILNIPSVVTVTLFSK